jgi:SAM-dependent methyltransferase
MSEIVDFDQMYRDERTLNGLPAATPWDIGEPQPVIRQLVAHGAVRGRVLDPGTGPGHNAIYYASHGHSVTGIDGSSTAIERANDNARAAGVTVDFQIGDATKLDGLDGAFDTVVDSAFYHCFLSDEQIQLDYIKALHRATKPGARLYMFEFGRHNVNGFSLPNGIPEDNFRRILPEGGWNITYLGPTTYQANLNLRTVEVVAANNPEGIPFLDGLRAIAPLLVDDRLHAPFWEVHATRAD